MGIILHKMAPADLAWLFGGLLLLVGALYLLKERRRSVVVPYLRVLRQAMGKSLAESSALNLRRLWSFLLQAGLLFLIVLVLADPEWDGQLNMVESQKVDQPVSQLVVLVDRSRSMAMKRDELSPCPYPAVPPGGATPLDPSLCAFRGEAGQNFTTFDAAKGRAAFLIHDSEPGTRVLLATLDRRISVHAVWEERAQALKVLAKLQSTDLEDSPEAAKPWLRNLLENHPGARVRVVTDLQRSKEWSGFRDKPWTVEGVGRTGGNLVLERFRVRADITEPGSAVARCSVYYDGSGASSRDVGFTLEVSAAALSSADSRVVVAVEHRRLEAGAHVDIDIKLSGLPGGVLNAKLVPQEPGSDLVESDSQRWAVVPALKPVRVRVVGEPPPFLLAALLADPFVELLQPVEEMADSSDAAEILVFVGRYPTKLTRPTLIFSPPVANHPLAGVVKLEPGQAKAASHAFWKRFDPGEIAFEEGVALVPADGERVLLSSGQAVVATLGRHDGLPLVRFGLDPFEEGLGTSPFFPALVARAVDFLQTRLDLIGQEYEVGHVVLDSDEHIGVKRLFSSTGREVFLGGTAEHRTAWIEHAGLYIAHGHEGDISSVVVSGTSDTAEGAGQGEIMIAGQAPRLTRKSVTRSGLWVGLLAFLALALLVEHALFIWRRVW